MLIDTHCHLASRGFSDTPVADLVDRAVAAGVGEMITIGTDLDDSARNIELAETFDPVYATVGIHPTSAHEIDSTNDAWLETLKSQLTHVKVVALGEIGLDFYHPPQDGGSEEAWRALQDRVFRQQLELAVDTAMPVVIHQRDSYDELVEVLRPYAGRLRAVFHCFTGSPEQLAELYDLGFQVSFTGVVTFKNAPLVQASAAAAPAGRFMVETDAPYLAPVPMRGKRCEPAYTRHTAEFVAKLLGIDYQQIAKETTTCAREFFQY